MVKSLTVGVPSPRGKHTHNINKMNYVGLRLIVSDLIKKEFMVTELFWYVLDAIVECSDW